MKDHRDIVEILREGKSTHYDNWPTRVLEDFHLKCNAAIEIQLLRKERDEARREVMSGIIDQACRSEDIDKEYKKRGWEYLKENTDA